MSDLRFHLERRTDGKWAPPQKQRTTGLMFTTGKKVEVSFEKENYRDVWFPATVLEDSGNDSFFVEYQSPGIGDEEPGLVKKIVDSLHIRPSPPNLKDKNFVLLDKVDAFFDFGWWSGVITKELADSRYLVLFKHTNKERELNQSELRPHMEWRDGKWFSASRRQICSPEDGVKRITPLPNLFSTWHKDCLISSDNQGKHIKKTKQTSPDDDTHARPLRKLKEGNGAETSSYQEVCQVNTSPLDGPSKAIPYGFGSPSTTGINSSEQPMAAVDQSIVKPCNFLQGEEVESNQFGGGGSSIQKGRRGRPPKLLAVRKQNREVAAHDKMIVKDEVGLPTTDVKEKLVCGLPKQINNSSHMMKTPLVKKDSQNVSTGKAAGGFKKDCFTKEVQKKIIKSPSTNSMPDDQPLSTWFEGMRSQTTINGSTISPDKNVEESTEGGKEQKLAAGAAGYKESEALLSEVQRLPFVKNIELWRAIESMEVIQRMPQKPHFRDLESCNEIYREGLAVACMVNFSSLVQSTAKLRLEDPRSKIEGKLKTLVELEGHGFNVKLVRDRLNELLLLKDRHEELQKQYKEEESEITERNLEKSEIEEKNDDMTKKLRELEETQALIMAKKEKKDSEIASLELRVEGINDAIRSLGHEFVEVLAAATDALS